MPVADECSFIRTIKFIGLNKEAALYVKLLLPRHTRLYVDHAANGITAVFRRKGPVNNIYGIDLIRADQGPARGAIEGRLQEVVQRKPVGIDHAARSREHIGAADTQYTIRIAYVALADLQTGHILQHLFRGLSILTLDLCPRYTGRGRGIMGIPFRLPP